MTPKNSAMKCGAFSRFTWIDWLPLSYYITERNTFKATITSDSSVRLDIKTCRPKLHRKISLRLVLLRPNTHQTYSTSRCFHNVSSIKTDFVYTNAAELQDTQSQKIYTSLFEKLKMLKQRGFTQVRPWAAPRSRGQVSHPSSATATAAGARTHTHYTPFGRGQSSLGQPSAEGSAQELESYL